MRVLLMPFVVFLLVIEMSLSCHAAEEADIPTNWQGFATGSYRLAEFSSTFPQSRPRKSQTKTVLQPFEGSIFTQYSDRDDFQRPVEGYTHAGEKPEEIGFKVVERKEEQITVAGKEYQAAVTTLRKENHRGKMELTMWEVKDLKLHSRRMGAPGPDFFLNENVIKATFKIEGPKISQTQSQTVVKLAEKLTVAEQEIECMVEKLEADVNKGGATAKVQGENWTSTAVPGREVKTLAKGTFSKDSERWPGETFEENSVLIDFKAIPKDE